jgi:hypothetical protein
VIRSPVLSARWNTSTATRSAAWVIVGTNSGLSARHEVDKGQLVARPFRNDTMHKTFSPNPVAAGPYDRRFLGIVTGRIDDPTD